MSARPSPTERAEVFIDLMLCHLQLPSRNREDIITGALLKGYVTSTKPLRLSSTGHRALRGIKAGTITASPAAIARAQEGSRENARVANLSREERLAEAHRDYFPPAEGIGGRAGGNNPATAQRRRNPAQRPPQSPTGFQFINGKVVP